MNQPTKTKKSLIYEEADSNYNKQQRLEQDNGFPLTALLLSMGTALLLGLALVGAAIVAIKFL